jgi:selT/selW/selH-like putative selenoprotein
LAAKIKEALAVEPVLIPEGRGIFDVLVDGNLVYSKFETGTFPDNDQLVSLLLSDHGEKSV